VLMLIEADANRQLSTWLQ